MKKRFTSGASGLVNVWRFRESPFAIPCPVDLFRLTVSKLYSFYNIQVIELKKTSPQTTESESLAVGRKHLHFPHIYWVNLWYHKRQQLLPLLWEGFVKGFLLLLLKQVSVSYSCTDTTIMGELVNWAYSMPASVLRALDVTIAYIILAITRWGKGYYLHLTDEKIET